MVKFLCELNDEDFISVVRASYKEILFSIGNNMEELDVYLDPVKAKSFAEEILSLVEDCTND